MQNQNTPSAPANNMTPMRQAKTQTTGNGKGPRTLNQTIASITERIKNTPPATAEEIERQRQAEAASLKNDRRSRFADLISKRGKRYSDCTLGNFEVTCPKQEHVVKELRAYVEHMQQNVKSGRGVVLFGPAGTGKDHLLIALAREAIERDISVAWENTMDFFGDVRDSFDNQDRREAELVSRLAGPRILILSDPLPPFGKLSEFQANVLIRVVDKRYSFCRPTWVSINCSSRKEAIERMGSQIVDRLTHGAAALSCDWESYRK